MNALQKATEQLLGYPIEWSDTAAWLQAGAAAAGLFIVWTIARAEVRAQRIVAQEEQERFNNMMFGIADAAINAIVEASENLTDINFVQTYSDGWMPAPSTASYVNVIKALDLNRAPSAAAAMELAEVRRLASWTSRYVRSASANLTKHGSISPELEEALINWRRDALHSSERLKIMSK